MLKEQKINVTYEQNRTNRNNEMQPRQIVAMKWFKKLFPSTASDNPGESVTSQELGDYLFGLCLRQVESFLDLWEHTVQEKTIVSSVSRDDIDQVELLIAFMWSYFDLLQNEKYLDAFTRMHGRFRQHMTELNIDADEMWHLLQARYDEYRQSHRSKGTIDFTYQRVSWEIAKNIHGPNLWLEFQVGVSLKQNVLHIGKAIKNMSLSKA